MGGLLAVSGEKPLYQSISSPESPKTATAWDIPMN
jgi:hypothetical protein